MLAVFQRPRPLKYFALCVCVCVCADEGLELVASVRLEPQVALPGGQVRTRDPPEGSTVPERHETVLPLRVDRFPVTNADFMYVTTS